MSLVDLKGKNLSSGATILGPDDLSEMEAQRTPLMRTMPEDFDPAFVKDGDFITYDDGRVRLGFKKPENNPELYLKLVEALRIAVWRSLELYRIRKLQ